MNKQFLDKAVSLINVIYKGKDKFIQQFTDYIYTYKENFTRETFENREQWLEARKNGIGGSSCSSILGLNPYQSNHDYWEIKVGKKQAEDISDKPAVHYGSLAEDNIRNMFQLDYENILLVYHHPYEILSKNGKPFIKASLDGEILVLQDCVVCGKRLRKGMRGILETKTCEPMRCRMLENWKDDNVPTNYHCQRLHYLLASDYDFHILRCDFRVFYKETTMWKHWTKDYCILKREVDVIDQVSYLETKETEFWEVNIVREVEPNIIVDL